MRRKLKGSQSMIQETILSWLPRGMRRKILSACGSLDATISAQRRAQNFSPA